MPSKGLSLSDLVGQKLYIKIPVWKQDKPIYVTLVGVDAGGIWIESNDFMEEFLEGTPHKMTEKSMQVFVPYSQVLAIYHFGGGPWISETVAE
jgi:hypothetical protein